MIRFYITAVINELLFTLMSQFCVQYDDQYYSCKCPDSSGQCGINLVPDVEEILHSKHVMLAVIVAPNLKSGRVEILTSMHIVPGCS